MAHLIFLNGWNHYTEELYVSCVLSRSSAGTSTCFPNCIHVSCQSLHLDILNLFLHCPYSHWDICDIKLRKNIFTASVAKQIGTDCPEKLWGCWKPYWAWTTHLWWERTVSTGLGLSDPRSFLPTSALMWFCSTWCLYTISGLRKKKKYILENYSGIHYLIY